MAGDGGKTKVGFRMKFKASGRSVGGKEIWPGEEFPGAVDLARSLPAAADARRRGLDAGAVQGLLKPSDH